MKDEVSPDLNEPDQFPRWKHHHQGGNLWLALIFIIVGFLLLLQNFGLVSPTVWSEIAKFWPLIVVMLGLEMIFGHSTLGRFLMLLIVLFILIWILSTGGLLPQIVTVTRFLPQNI